MPQMNKGGKFIFGKSVIRDNGMKLLSIRSSDIAFTMGAYGRLVDESMKHDGEIPLY